MEERRIMAKSKSDDQAKTAEEWERKNKILRKKLEEAEKEIAFLKEATKFFGEKWVTIWENYLPGYF